MLEHSWTAEFAEVPADASPPLYMTPVPEDAVGSYAAEVCECCGLTGLEFMERAERKTFRWWQRLAVTRQLEHRADGSLCHDDVLDSASRRSGKSLRVRGVALWRMKHGLALFGEVQTILHTGSDMAICREIQRGAWRYSEDVAGWTVTKANGKEAIESHDGDRWLVRSQEGVYGYDCTLGMGDECWNVKPATITEGVEPAALERASAQVHLTSTAHRRATSLMRNKILATLTAAEPEPRKLRLIWAAPHGSDPSSPEVWRAASPYWTPARHEMMQAKYDAALAGEVDPQADDPDPMAGFVAQYLNVWPIRAADVLRGDPVVSEFTWTPLAVGRPEGVPVAAAIESWFAAGVSLALAWRDDTRSIIAVTDHVDLSEAVEVLKATGYRGRVTIGKSLVKVRDPALKGVRVVPGEGRVGAAAEEVTRLLNEDGLRHDGGEHLTEQLLNVRTVESADGARIVSKGRADAVKAMVWAANSARSKARSSTRRRVLTAAS